MKKSKAKFKYIMIIDDNEIDNFINKKIIESTNFSDIVYVHSSAKSALEFLSNLSKAPELLKLAPELIFVDINMPITDGFQFMVEYGKLDANIVKKSRIIMLTTSINPDDLIKSQKDTRIHRFINKPLTSDHLKLIS